MIACDKGMPRDMRERRRAHCFVFKLSFQRMSASVWDSSRRARAALISVLAVIFSGAKRGTAAIAARSAPYIVFFGRKIFHMSASHMRQQTTEQKKKGTVPILAVTAMNLVLV